MTEDDLMQLYRNSDKGSCEACIALMVAKKIHYCLPEGDAIKDALDQYGHIDVTIKLSSADIMSALKYVKKTDNTGLFP